MNDINSTSATELGQSVADNLQRIGELPDGSFVAGYLVLAQIVRLDGTEDAVYIHSQGLGRLAQIGLMRTIQLELERD